MYRSFRDRPRNRLPSFLEDDFEDRQGTDFGHFGPQPQGDASGDKHEGGNSHTEGDPLHGGSYPTRGGGYNNDTCYDAFDQEIPGGLTAEDALIYNHYLHNRSCRFRDPSSTSYDPAGSWYMGAATDHRATQINSGNSKNSQEQIQGKVKSPEWLLFQSFCKQFAKESKQDTNRVANRAGNETQELGEKHPTGDEEGQKQSDEEEEGKRKAAYEKLTSMNPPQYRSVANYSGLNWVKSRGGTKTVFRDLELLEYASWDKSEEPAEEDVKYIERVWGGW